MNDLKGLYNELRAYKASRLLSVAFHFQIPHCLLGKALTISEIAELVDIDEYWLMPVMGVLTDRRITRKNEERFELTDYGKLAISDDSLSAIVGYHFHCFDAWTKLPPLLSTGLGGNFHKERLCEPGFAVAYLKAMDTIAANNIDFLTGNCIEYLADEIIDIGAGPATLTRKISEMNQEATIFALDHPEISAAAKEMYKVDQNFNWVAGDFWQWHPAKPADAIFCSHFLEYANVIEFQKNIDRLKSYVKKGGWIVLVTFLRSNEMCAELDLFELSTGLNGNSLGHIFEEDVMLSNLTSNGLIIDHFVHIPNGPSYGEALICCKKD